MDLSGNPTNPILDELAKLSPGAEAAITAMHGGAAAPGAGAGTPAASTPAPIPMRPPGANAVPKLPSPQLGAEAPPPAVTGAPMMAPAKMPEMSAMTPAPRVTDVDQDRLVGDQNELARLNRTGSGVSQIYSKVTNSGFGQRHPVLGKLLGGAAEGVGLLADAGASAVAPEVTAMLPGTEYHHDRLVNQARAQVGEDEGAIEKQAQDRLLNAEGAGKEEANVNEPQAAADTHALTESEVSEHNAQAAALLHPQAKTDFEAWAAQNPGKPIEEWIQLQRKPSSMESKAGTVNGKRVFANFHPDTGKYTDTAGNEIAGFVPEPPSALITEGDKNLWSVQQPDGSRKVVSLRAGDTIPKGAVSLSGQNSESVAGDKADQAAAKAMQDSDSELALMQQFAAQPSPTNDAAMLMHYIGATKPESMGKIRLNDRELKLFGETRSSIGDAEALLTKVANGQSLTPQQRQDMLNTMTTINQAAHRGGAGGGEASPKEGDVKTNAAGDKVKFSGGKWGPA